MVPMGEDLRATRMFTAPNSEEPCVEEEGLLMPKILEDTDVDCLPLRDLDLERERSLTRSIWDSIRLTLLRSAYSS